jgi:hypothetical protein
MGSFQITQVYEWELFAQVFSASGRLFNVLVVLSAKQSRDKFNDMRFEVITAVKMSILVFWVVMPYGLEVDANVSALPP